VLLAVFAHHIRIGAALKGFAVCCPLFVAFQKQDYSLQRIERMKHINKQNIFRVS
jgi:hypothetical protein